MYPGASLPCLAQALARRRLICTAMEFNAIQLPQITVLQDPARGTPATLPKTWQLGQILSATAAAATDSNGQTRLNIAGVLLTAQTDKPLAAGETLNLKLAQLPGLPLAKALNVPVQQLSQSQSTLLLSAPEAVLKGWQVGQLLRANTIEQSSSGEALLDIGGRLLTADTTRSLARGQPLTVRVLNLANPLLLQILERGADAKPGQTDPATAPARANLPVISPSLRLILPGVLLQRLQAGDTLDTRVSQATQQGRAVLSINGRAVTALTTLPLTQGQTLKLEISDLGKPPVLVPVTSGGRVEDVLTQQLRTLLPQQTGLPELLSNLAVLGSGGPAIQPLREQLSATVGQQLRALAQQILQQLPRPGDAASAKGVKQALQQSGLFMENQLAKTISQQLPLPAADLKANLLRLLALLQRQLNPRTAPPAKSETNPRQTADNRSPAPPLRHAMPEAQAKTAASLLQHTTAQRMLGELLRQVDGNLARIQLHQLASLHKEHDAARVISTEIPLHHGSGTDVFHVRIDEQPAQQQTTPREKTWSITLAFDIGEMGPVHVKLTLGGDIINTTFWAQQASTKHAIDTQLSVLQHNMLKAGLSIGHIVCHHGQPPQPMVNPSQPSYIVDVQA